MWHIYTIGYYSAIKNKEILSFATTWMELENIMLGKISRAQKDELQLFLLIKTIELMEIVSRRMATKAGKGSRQGGKVGMVNECKNIVRVGHGCNPIPYQFPLEQFLNKSLAHKSSSQASRLGGVTHTYNPSTWEAKVGESRGQEFKTSLSNMHFGRPSQESCVRPGVRHQLGHHDKTLSPQKIQKLARCTASSNHSLIVMVPYVKNFDKLKSVLAGCEGGSFCHPDWSAAAQSQLTVTSTSQVQTFSCLSLPIEMGFHHVVQAGLKLLTSSDPSTMVSQSAGITLLRRLRPENCLNLGSRGCVLWEAKVGGSLEVRDQPGQHVETSSLLKTQKLARGGGRRLWSQLLRRLRQKNHFNPGGRGC
ncbi:retrotransposable element ORF2 protein, partial [Plecturocebus cupreus]